MYSTDNGPHANTWPDGATTPFRNEKNSNRKGAFRVPEMVRWPGKIPAGAVSNEIIRHHDWLPTLVAAAGEPTVVDKLKQGHTIGDQTYHVHIDGYDLLPYLTGEVDKTPRRGLIYFSDDCDVLGIRIENWFLDHDYIAFMANAVVLQFLDTFNEFPPRREPASFTITNAVDKLNDFLQTMGG